MLVNLAHCFEDTEKFVCVLLGAKNIPTYKIMIEYMVVSFELLS
jgi:hypothetical protein